LSIPLPSPLKRGRPDVASLFVPWGSQYFTEGGEFKASLLEGERLGERFSRSREK
jgi:hypothetical protein